MAPLYKEQNRLISETGFLVSGFLLYLPLATITGTGKRCQRKKKFVVSYLRMLASTPGVTVSGPPEGRTGSGVSKISTKGALDGAGAGAGAGADTGAARIKPIAKNKEGDME